MHIDLVGLMIPCDEWECGYDVDIHMWLVYWDVVKTLSVGMPSWFCSISWLVWN